MGSEEIKMGVSYPNNSGEIKHPSCNVSNENYDDCIPEVQVKIEEDSEQDGSNSSWATTPTTNGYEMAVVVKDEELDIPSNEYAVCNGDFEAFHLKKEVYTPTERLYECETCGERFTLYNDFKSHFLVHKFHVCQTCGACFVKRSALRYHIFSHTGGGPYKCEMCEASFLKKSSLRYHLFRHTGEGPHKCEICGISFFYVSLLRRHKLKHSGERPYNCIVCEKSFRQMVHLKRHMLLHSENTTHECETCGESFGNAMELRRHTFLHS